MKMIEINIPGRKPLCIQNIVLDYNGTLALDGVLKTKIIDQIFLLSKSLKIYILTADTNGTVAKQCDKLPVEVVILEGGGTTSLKKEFIVRLDETKTVAIGNGANDVEMLKVAALSFAVIGEEGCFSKAIIASTISVTDIEHALDMLINKNRLIATLRE